MPARKTKQPIADTTDKHLDALLTLLADNPMLVISGEKIAKEVGVTRSSVWRWITRLRELGVRVKGHPKSGYHIESIPDILIPNLLRRGLAGTPYAKRIVHFFKVDSTNRVAMELGQQSEPHGTLVVAEEQSAGRGRTGRAWYSEKSSGVYMSILLRPQLTPMQAAALTLAAGLAVRDTVAAMTGMEPDVRWPNDVLLNGKKVCGILTEMYAEPDRIRFIVVGVGVNVNHAKMPAELAAIATSLRIVTGKVYSRLDLATRLLGQFDTYYNQLLTQGAAPIVARFTAVSSFAQGRRVHVTTGSESFNGTTAGLDPSGLLRVKRDDGRVETLLAADISEAQDAAHH